MKILLFNHHPDCLTYLYTAFSELGIEVEIASERLTKQFFHYSSTLENGTFQFADVQIKFEDFNPIYKNVVIANDINHDIILSIRPQIMSYFGKNAWYDCQMQGEFFRHNNDSIRTCNHPDSELMNFKFCPNWVPQKELVKEKRYITQLMTAADIEPQTNILRNLKNKGYDVMIANWGEFIKDYDILPSTSMLVHNKKTGMNCYAVCKALDMGIPVYMERFTRKLIGFGNLPEELFLFIDDMSMEEAYKKSLEMDNKKIQEIYRSIYSLDNLKKAVVNILERK
jgi:hypothetical protein